MRKRCNLPYNPPSKHNFGSFWLNPLIYGWKPDRISRIGCIEIEKLVHRFFGRTMWTQEIGKAKGHLQFKEVKMRETIIWIWRETGKSKKVLNFVIVMIICGRAARTVRKHPENWVKQSKLRIIKVFQCCQIILAPFYSAKIKGLCRVICLMKWPRDLFGTWKTT